MIFKAHSSAELWSLCLTVSTKNEPYLEISSTQSPGSEPFEQWEALSEWTPNLHFVPGYSFSKNQNIQAGDLWVQFREETLQIIYTVTANKLLYHTQLILMHLKWFPFFLLKAPVLSSNLFLHLALWQERSKGSSPMLLLPAGVLVKSVGVQRERGGPGSELSMAPECKEARRKLQ